MSHPMERTHRTTNPSWVSLLILSLSVLTVSGLSVSGFSVSDLSVLDLSLSGGLSWASPQSDDGHAVAPRQGPPARQGPPTPTGRSDEGGNLSRAGSPSRTEISPPAVTSHGEGASSRKGRSSRNGSRPRAGSRDRPVRDETAAATRRTNTFVLLILPDKNARSGSIDQADLVRLVSLLLEPSGFSVQSGKALTTPSFPRQVDQARIQAEAAKASAVVWYRTSRPGNQAPELFLHLLDLLTDKTLVRTIKVTGRRDLERVAALKLWALLRASLLEMRADRATADLPAPVAAITEPVGVKLPSPAGKGTGRSGRRTDSWRLSFSIGYGAGLFLSGQGFFHGAEISGDINLKHWKSGLALALGLDMVLPGRLDILLDDASLQIHLLPMVLDVSLRWNQTTWFLSGSLRAGLTVLSAAADIPAGPAFRVTKADPTTGMGIEAGWHPTTNTALVGRVAADAIWRGQCFKRGTESLCLDRMSFWAGLGFRMDL